MSQDQLLALLPSRIQFGFTVSFHIMFPAFTIGLAAWLAVLEAMHLSTGLPVYRRLFDFWLTIFAVAFGLGVVSGIVMAFQFGSNWSELSRCTGPIQGPLLAYESFTAFALEASFFGILIFGRSRVRASLYLFSGIMVALGTSLSSFWILVNNSWMQWPVGFEMTRDGIFQPNDWPAIIFSPVVWVRFPHMMLAAYVTTSFCVAATGAWHLGRHGRDVARLRAGELAGLEHAGTGHAANCELNYIPQRADGSVDISKALEVNTEFNISRQLWAYLVGKGAIPDPRAYLHPCPHMSFVWGTDNVASLRARFKEMSAHHCYHGMEYSEDAKQIAEWAPLVIDGRSDGEPIAATRIVTGTDADYGALTHLLVKHLSAQQGFVVHYNRKVVDLTRESDGRWRAMLEDTYDGSTQTMTAKFVFIGAGGGSLPLLQKSNIPEGRGYGGFPVSGIWLRCLDEDVAKHHHAKVYGKAASGSPPMSVPHLDTRIIGGKRALLFGPYAGFSTRFLKHGKLTDLFRSLTVRTLDEKDRDERFGRLEPVGG